jgi:hypothetical protein
MKMTEQVITQKGWRAIAVIIAIAVAIVFSFPIQADAAAKKGWSGNAKTGYSYYKSGKQVNGWQKIGSSWYYFSAKKMKSGWQKVSGKWYYLGSKTDGKMKSGWQKVSGKWYYFGSAGDGKMRSGWQKISGKWYYFGGADDGKMKTGYQTIGGTKYLFAESGAMDASYNPTYTLTVVDNLTLEPLGIGGGQYHAGEEVHLIMPTHWSTSKFPNRHFSSWVLDWPKGYTGDISSVISEFRESYYSYSDDNESFTVTFHMPPCDLVARAA